jgi:hypothetical protein
MRRHRTARRQQAGRSRSASSWEAGQRWRWRWRLGLRDVGRSRPSRDVLRPMGQPQHHFSCAHHLRRRERCHRSRTVRRWSLSDTEEALEGRNRNRCALCRQPQDDSDFAALVVEYHGNEPEPGDEPVSGVSSTPAPGAERADGHAPENRRRAVPGPCVAGCSAPPQAEPPDRPSHQRADGYRAKNTPSSGVLPSHNVRKLAIGSPSGRDRRRLSARIEKSLV